MDSTEQILTCNGPHFKVDNLKKNVEFFKKMSFKIYETKSDDLHISVEMKLHHEDAMSIWLEYFFESNPSNYNTLWFEVRAINQDPADMELAHEHVIEILQERGIEMNNLDEFKDLNNVEWRVVDTFVYEDYAE